jgi:serine/threonine-protein kinase
MPLQTGEVLNTRYRIVRLLGQGGFGAVYRAWDLSLKIPCALKENLDNTPEAQRQFAREAIILGNLDHPGLPRVTDHFSIPGQGQHLVMDYIEGEDLDQMLKLRNGPLPEVEVLPWIRQICDALAYLHSQTPPVIHRDIKPANIKIRPDGKAVLVDFGLAKIFDEHLRTTVGAQAVTPGFSPLEQYGRAPTDNRTDIYAMGASLYTLLTSYPPPESIQRLHQDHLQSPRVLNPAVSVQTETALLGALALQPENRYPRIEAFKAALGEPDVRANYLVPWLKALRRWWGAALLCIVLIAGGLGLAAALRDGDQGTPSPVEDVAEIPNGIDQAEEVPESQLETETPAVIVGEVPTSTQLPLSTPTVTNTPVPSVTALPSVTGTPTPTSIPPLPPAFEWNTELVQGAQDRGYFTSLAIDPQDNQHIAYFQENFDILWYAHNANGRWEFEDVLGGNGSNWDLALALDSQSRPHLAYHLLESGEQDPEVRYRRWNGVDWEIFRVYDSYAARVRLGLTLDEADDPHITYVDGFTYNLTYLHFSLTTGWESQIVDRSSEGCKSNGLALDGEGVPHVSYMSDEGQLMYAVLEEGVWQRYLVDPDPGTGQYSSLALDPAGQPHIAYYDSHQQALKYALRVEAAWDIVVVDSGPDVGQYPSLALGSQGGLHISYYDAGNKDLKYAHGREDQWDLYLVDDWEGVGKWTSLALDSHGIPYISYLDEDNQDLKLAQAYPTTR